MKNSRGLYIGASLALAISASASLAMQNEAQAGAYAPSPVQVSFISSMSAMSAAATMTAATRGLVELKMQWERAASRAAPQNARFAAGAGKRPAGERRQAGSAATGVFGSVAIPFRALPSSASWKAVYPSIARADFAACTEAGDCAQRAKDLAQLVRDVKAGPFSRKLAEINRAVNRRIAYVSDRNNYRQLDLWAKPRDILQRGKGDCEDYAILKMAALNAAGIPLGSMSIVVLQDQRRSLFHAVLTVSTSQGHYVLDNLHDRVMKDTAFGDYLPLYSLSADRSWIHGRKRDGSMVATLEGLPSDLSPGEGFDNAAAPQNRVTGVNGG